LIYGITTIYVNDEGVLTVVTGIFFTMLGEVTGIIWLFRWECVCGDKYPLHT